MHRIDKVVVSVAAIGCVVLAASIADAAPIFGGPLYDGSSGYLGGTLNTVPNGTAGNGMATGHVWKYQAGVFKSSRAVRWDANGVVEVLDTLGSDAGGSTPSQAFSLNASGTAVGFSYRFDGNSFKGERAVKWNASGTAAIELPNLGTGNDVNYGADYTDSGALTIRDDGTIVGYARKYQSGADKGTRAVRWDASGTTVTELGNLGTNNIGASEARATTINAAGTVVGYARKYESTADKGTRAARWEASGTAITELGHLGTTANGVTNSRVNALSNSGVSVGYASKYEAGVDKGFRAVRWDAVGTSATELGNLGTDSNGLTQSFAISINAAGTAVGSARKYLLGVNKGDRAVRWDISGTTATELETLGTNASGYAVGNANAINASGTIVGYVEHYNNAGSLLAQRAVVWDTAGAVTDLNTLLAPGTGWVNLFHAAGISDTYWITGTGKFDPDGVGGQAAYDRVFLLDAVLQFGKKGDATRDGVVNFNDLLILAQKYGMLGNATWDMGDFNGDGAIGFDDLLSLAQSYQPSSLTGVKASELFAADWALARSLVPEPVSLMFIAACGWCQRRRRA